VVDVLALIFLFWPLANGIEIIFYGLAVTCQALRMIAIDSGSTTLENSQRVE
jgi:hypothetical protein